MDRSEELRNDEAERAGEMREAARNRAERGDDGYTNSDSLVRDDSLLGRHISDDMADRTPRATGRANSHDDVHPDDAPSVGDHVGEAAGGISGVVAGAAIGSLGGPIGTVIGGIAGAIGGWWTGRAIAEAAANFSHADDEQFRSDYTTRGAEEPSNPDRGYERVRPAYQLGYLASRNPEYAGRSFDEIEPHLARGWNGNSATEGGEWADMREYARTAYVRGAAAQSSLTGDSSARNSLSSTGTEGSIGTGSDSTSNETESDSMSGHGQGDTPTTSFASGSSSQSSDNADAAERLASPKGSSFTRQGDVPLNSSATDRAGAIRGQDTEKQATRETSELRGSEPNRGPSFTDPVAGEGVENIASSGGAPRGEEGTLNESPRDADKRTGNQDSPHKY